MEFECALSMNVRNIVLTTSLSNFNSEYLLWGLLLERKGVLVTAIRSDLLFTSHLKNPFHTRESSPDSSHKGKAENNSREKN